MRHPNTITIMRETGKEIDEVAEMIHSLQCNGVDFDLRVTSEKYVFELK